MMSVYRELNGGRWHCKLSSEAIAHHPRVCGRRLAQYVELLIATESSPRVRGTLDDQARVAEVHRIIPACAGDAMSATRSRCLAPDHPRVCGGRANTASDGSEQTGSSPRVRGTRQRRSSTNSPKRIIPACAGDAEPGTCPTRPCTDHPRVCGGRTLALGSPLDDIGSSPRVRGTLSRAGLTVEEARIIPACAGDAAHRACRRWRTTDHPRVCGGRTSR